MRSNDEELMQLFLDLLVLMAVALIIYGLILLGIGVVLFVIFWFLLSLIRGFIQYHSYLKEARDEFDQAVQDLGVDLPVDDIFHSIGIEVAEDGGFETAADWLVGTPLGISQEWES